jgi:hypothetical protein
MIFDHGGRPEPMKIGLPASILITGRRGRVNAKSLRGYF